MLREEGFSELLELARIDALASNGDLQYVEFCQAKLAELLGRALYISSYAVRQSLPGLGLYRVSKLALDGLIECWRMEHPDVDFTRVVVGNTSGTGFADDWSPERLRHALSVWMERNLFPAATMMSLDVLAESLVAILAAPGYVDDVALMPRTRDPKASG